MSQIKIKIEANYGVDGDVSNRNRPFLEGYIQQMLKGLELRIDTNIREVTESHTQVNIKVVVDNNEDKSTDKIPPK
jgi:hypothetical protein